jgi:antirestriction protein ArdC
MRPQGENGNLVVYASTITRTETDGESGRSPSGIPFLKGYTVFNVQQIDGLPAHFTAPEPRLDPVQRIGPAEQFFSATAATVQHGGNQAYYSVASDLVQMPLFETFRDAESEGSMSALVDTIRFNWYGIAVSVSFCPMRRVRAQPQLSSRP